MINNKDLQKKYINEAYEIIGEAFSSSLVSVRFKIENNTGNNISSIKERHPVTLFFNHMNTCIELLQRNSKDKYDYKNILNEFRPILFNKSDVIHYLKILNIQERMLTGNYYNGTKITVLDLNDVDVTDKYLNDLKKVKKTIESLINKSDLDFLYNGVLQHSDTRYAEVYLEHIRKNDIELIELKNVVIITYIFELLMRYTYPLHMFIVQSVNI